MRTSHVIEYAAARTVVALVSFLPHRATLALAWGIARLAFWPGGRLQRRTLRRLRQALGPELPERELKRIAWTAFRNLAFTAAEGMRLPRMTPEWVARRIDLSPLELARENMKDGRGVIVAVPHMGNWEMAGIALHSQGFRLMTLARRQKNPLMDAWINRIRKSTGVEAIENRSRGMVEIAPKLMAGLLLALLPDVRAKVRGVPVKFLGADTAVPAGAARFARETGVPVLTGVVERRGWTRFEWKGTGRITSDPALDEQEDRRRIMQYIMSRFEESIRANPENYFWFNKRWILGEEPPL